MIKASVEYRLKEGANIESVLLKLRTHAMQYVGFVSAENLCSEIDGSIVIMTSTWLKYEDWLSWNNSRVRQKILRTIMKRLVEEPRVTIYKIMPTSDWVHNRIENGSSDR